MNRHNQDRSLEDSSLGTIVAMKFAAVSCVLAASIFGVVVPVLTLYFGLIMDRWPSLLGLSMSAVFVVYGLALYRFAWRLWHDQPITRDNWWGLRFRS